MILCWVKYFIRSPPKNVSRISNDKLCRSKRAREFRKNIYFCFSDYAKIFDSVNHNKLWKIRKDVGMPGHLTCLLRNLYAGQEASVRTGYGTTDWFQTGKGVCQGCILSPAFLSLYAYMQSCCCESHSVVSDFLWPHELCSPWDCEESDMTERLQFPFSLPCIGEGNGNPLQCSCLENHRDGGAWWAAVYGVSQSWTRLMGLSSSSSSSCLFNLYAESVQFSSVTQSCPTLCDPMNRSTPGLPVHHQLPEFTQTHVHWVGDAIQPSPPVLSPSPPAPNPSQHQSLFQWANFSHEGAKLLEFQL